MRKFLIADRLHVSTRTVSTHKTNIMRKFGSASIAELTMADVRDVLLNPQE